jgi:RND superfamily putative drug exporter
LLVDYDRAVSSRLPLLILVLAAVTYLLLVPVFRALVLPLVAVLLNLLTVGCAFGVMTLLFQGSAPLGGPGYIDSIAVAGTFAVIFGLSIDYVVFLLSRMREGYLRTGSTDRAVEYGLSHTARVVTGAAAIMAGVFVAFSLTDFIAIRQFGVGLTIAIALDATVVRLVLLPAIMRLLGRWNWWMPVWLDGRLPELKVEGGGQPAYAGGRAS